MKFLVIEDAQEIVDAVSLCLSLRWPDAEVLSAGEGRSGLELAEGHNPDLVILDIGLPDMSGLEVLRALRSASDVPVMMLTVRDEDQEIARYLEEGADEYMVKPFSHLESVGRIQALMRRAWGRARRVSRTLQAADLLIDFGAGEVHKAGEPVYLTSTELSFLERLVKNATRVVTYEALASDIKSGAEPPDTDARLVRLHVQHLRSKLDDLGETPRYIANVFGLGYKFLPQVTSSVSRPSQAAESQRAAPPPQESPASAPRFTQPARR